LWLTWCFLVPHQIKNLKKDSFSSPLVNHGEQLVFKKKTQPIVLENESQES
jgi:hypothetical protein